MTCPFCGDTREPEIDHHEYTSEPVTGVDEDNGPSYFAICPRCHAQGPLESWAADALTAWKNRTSSEKELENLKLTQERDLLKKEIAAYKAFQDDMDQCWCMKSDGKTYISEDMFNRAFTDLAEARAALSGQ